MTARPPRRRTLVLNFAGRSRRIDRIDEPTLFQFVVLSMLVHILAIMLFGATGRSGSAGKSDELLGTLDVSLQRPAPDRDAGIRIAPGPRDSASSVRPLRPAPETRTRNPPGRKSSQGEIAAPALESREPSAPPVDAAPTSPEESVPRLNRTAPDEVDKPLRPESPVTPTVPPELEAPSLEKIAPPAIERELAPPIEAPLRAIPAPAMPLERIVPPAVERTMIRPPELPPEAVPAVQSAPLERLAPSKVERELASPIEPLKEQPIEPGVPIQPAVPPLIERQLAPPVILPAQPLPAPAAPLERITPPASERQLAPAAEVPVPARAPVQPPAAELPSTAPARAPTAQPAPDRAPAAESGTVREPITREPIGRQAVRPAPEPTAPAAPRGITPGSIFDRTPGIETSPTPRAGTTSPEEEIFKPRTDRPGDAAAPRIDLDAAKKRAVRQSSGSGSTGVLPFPLPVPEKKTKEANAMEKAVKPDCRTAYAGMGLLAVPALVVAAVTDDGGCRW